MRPVELEGRDVIVERPTSHRPTTHLASSNNPLGEIPTGRTESKNGFEASKNSHQLLVGEEGNGKKMGVQLRGSKMPKESGGDQQSRVTDLRRQLENPVGTDTGLEVAVGRKSGQPSEQFEMPLWSDNRRAAPSSILRSSLFGLTPRSRNRDYFDDMVPFKAWDGVEIYYQGARLDQDDLSCWCQLIHESTRQLGVHNEVRFFRAQFLRALGRSSGGSGYIWLRETLDRLYNCSIEVREYDGKGNSIRGMDGRLIATRKFDEETGAQVVRLNPDIAHLFESNVTYMEWWIRHTLKGDLSRWLHNYISSHRATHLNPHFVAYNTLHHLSGSTASSKEFRRNVRESLKELTEAGVLKEWTVKRQNNIHMVRNPASELKKRNQEARQKVLQELARIEGMAVEELGVAL